MTGFLRYFGWRGVDVEPIEATEPADESAKTERLDEHEWQIDGGQAEHGAALPFADGVGIDEEQREETAQDGHRGEIDSENRNADGCGNDPRPDDESRRIDAQRCQRKQLGVHPHDPEFGSDGCATSAGDDDGCHERGDFTQDDSHQDTPGGFSLQRSSEELRLSGERSSHEERDHTDHRQRLEASIENLADGECTANVFGAHARSEGAPPRGKKGQEQRAADTVSLQGSRAQDSKQGGFTLPRHAVNFTRAFASFRVRPLRGAELSFRGDIRRGKRSFSGWLRRPIGRIHPSVAVSLSDS